MQKQELFLRHILLPTGHMLNNPNHSSLNANASSQGTPVWQSGWIEELWNQLENGSFNGIGNVVVDEDIVGSEQQILADLSAIDRMLIGTRDIQQMLEEVRDFAAQNRNYLNNPAGVDALPGTNFAVEAQRAAASLQEVMQYVQSQGLPDLTAEIDTLKFDPVALPGEKANLSITLKNEGGLRVRHAVTAKIYAQAQSREPFGEPSGETAAPPGPVEIGSLNFGKLKLSPGDSRRVTTAVELPDNLAPGDYNIFVVVDSDGNVPEANEANNIVVAAGTQTVAWQFGNVGGENKALTLRDHDGDRIRFQLQGDGYGEITEVDGVRQLTVYGTTDRSEVVIKANGNGHTLGDISIAGDLKRFDDSDTDLTGNLSVDGSLATLKLDDVSDAQITIGQGSHPERKVDIDLGDVNNLNLRSELRIDKLDAVSWTASADSNNLLVAPNVREIKVKGDFDANLDIAGDLKTVRVQGSAAGIWQIDGDSRLIKAGGTTTDWSVSVGGNLNYLYIQSALQGTVAAENIKRAFVKGDLNNAKLLIGTDLGSDGVAGGGDDSYDKGTLDALVVYGNIVSSVVGVGLDPRDDDFTNGNERLIEGSRIRGINIRGTVSDDSLLAAAIWPRRTWINRQRVNPETDDRFLTLAKVPTDAAAPVVTLSLAEDTGDTTDQITSVATIVGTVADESEVVVLKAGFGETPISDYVDISEYLQDGSFTLDAAALATVFGEPLTDGSYQLNIVAEDVFGNLSEPTSYSYTLDSEGPALLVTELQTAGSEAGLLRLVGSVNEAVTVAVTLLDAEPLEFTVASGAFEQSLQALPTEAGDYTLGITLTDVAGNTTQTTLDFTIEPADNEAPIVTLS